MKRHPRLSMRSRPVGRVLRGLEKWFEESRPTVDYIWNTDETGYNPQGFKAKKVVAEKGQKTTGVKRSNSRENVTVVATVNAAEVSMPPLLIFKGQRLQPAWISKPGSADSMYCVTESSMMTREVFLKFFKFIKKFREYIVKSGYDDGKPHVLILGGHKSHVTLEVLRYADANNIVLFQLPSHSSHLTQPLDVCVFGIFKRKITDILGRWGRDNCMKMPVKHFMAAIIGEAWPLTFTTTNIVASFVGAGISLVDMLRGINKLTGRGAKRKTRAFDRPPLACCGGEGRGGARKQTKSVVFEMRGQKRCRPPLR